MPAASKQQQKFFGVVKAMQAGDLPKKGAAGKVAKDMSKKDVDKYASTKHKGLPKKVKKETMKISDIKKMIGEELRSLTEIDQKVFDIYAVLGKALTKATSIPKAYRSDYGTSLIRLSQRDEKEFIDTYGASDIDDFIEDMEYNLQNEGKLNEGKFKVGDIVIPNVGAHKGIRHTVIHDFKDGRYNIQPIGLRPNQIQYRLGAASANEDQLKKVSSALQKVAPSIIDTSGMSKADIIKTLGEAKMTPAKVQKAQKELVATIQLLKKNFPMYKAAKDAGDDKKLEKHRKIALDLTKKKKQLELDLDKALGGLYQDAELDLKEAAPRMRIDPDSEQLMSILKDVSRIENKMKSRDRSRYSHVKRDFKKFFDSLMNLKSRLDRQGPTIPEGKLIEAVYDDMLKAVPDNYSYKNLASDVANIIKNEYGSHNIKPFIQELSKMLKEGRLNEMDINDPVLVAARAARDKSKAAPDARKRKMSFDKYFDLMDLEADLADQIKNVGEQINQLLADMEQEAEPGGGPIADRYGAKLDQLENRYIKLKQDKAKITKSIEDYRSS